MYWFRVLGHYCLAGCRLSSSVTLSACGPAGRRERGNAAWERCRWSGRPAAGRVDGRRAGSRARGIGRPTLHGGPVVLRPVTVTPCFVITYRIQRPLRPASACSTWGDMMVMIITDATKSAWLYSYMAGSLFTHQSPDKVDGLCHFLMLQKIF